ncbi:bifunctional precorrin-2 dehydrogenase/sirohydrochlorin ferrochelatase [Cohnella faecalis]|uniref:precorrin-2 dehydrogenase n=1 Tax=Cohnella faecalis TaxID=2315694 RepID=A0A398CXE4_9BACL|nr:NAD(P)-dependent oxidoreductase [Cohnella faecalis]RIE03891.1 hypothetical protein D3H35_07940 [Cohnella faecalis]
MAAWYPILLDLTGKRCVVVGGGPVAERKANGLLEAGASVCVVSPRLTEGLHRLASEGRIEWRRREAEETDVQGAALLFAATSLPEANRAMAEAARKAGGLANVADDGESGDFIVPAVVRRGELILAASASGAGPALAARIAGELAVRYGEAYSDYASRLRHIRTIVKASVSDRSERRRLLAAAVTEEALEEWRTGDWPVDSDKLIARLRERAGESESA